MGWRYGRPHGRGFGSFLSGRRRSAEEATSAAGHGGGTLRQRHIIQPTTTIINGPNGQRTVIVIPRQRSYLDTGTEVSVGDRGYMDYMLPPGGDPGRTNWFIGPDVQGRGSYPLPGPFSIPGFNPDTPY